MARRFGARHPIDSLQEDPRAAIERLTGGEGVEVAIEAVGLPQTQRLALDAACYAGRVALIGYAKKESALDTTLIVRKELDVRGSRNALRVFPAVIRMIEEGTYPFADLITRVYPFERTGDALRDWDADPAHVNKILIEVGA
jgi:threonine dehydrogenase-like Zn-dependent dehydrogenase